ncbi:MAG: MarR family transcriptional regulator [Chloroflexi bacterium]|nr:MarR family transcriptional regulator [Chloroflexota bacterium]
MPLNINRTTINPPSADVTPDDPDAADRQRLAAAVRDEIMSWDPREFIAAFRRWHHGSFSLIHLNVLTTLESESPASMGRLAEMLDVSVASMTGIVDRMERRGLVERRHEDKDRRVVLVSQTEAGRDIFREMDERRRVGLGKLLERLSADELEALLKGHRALRIARTQAFAARAAAASDVGSTDRPDATAQTPPSRLHRASTIPGDDPPVHPLTGAGR